MFLFIILICQLSLPSFAKEITTDFVSYIDYPTGKEKDTLLLLSSGNVLKLPSTQNQNLKIITDAKNKNQQVVFEINKDRRILNVSIKTLSLKKTALQSSSAHQEYHPTIHENAEDINSIFRNLRGRARRSSQCYNRAHVWAYESKNKFDLNSMKVFMFYTRRYIRRYNFHWWFHVAPFTYLKTNDAFDEKVLDYRFTQRPHAMKDWTDIFMHNKAYCPEIKLYSQYRDHQEDEDCYLLKVSMFYLQPLDLDNLERYQSVKTDWINYELKRAYRNGFGI